MIKFEPIKSCPDAKLPRRATRESAGYDFFIYEDIIVPSYLNMYSTVENKRMESKYGPYDAISLDETANIIKSAGCKLTLVPTGVKCKLDPGTYLELSVRSSTPLKSWLILANGVGIIDADYWNNPDNDGHIYFQLINLTPWNIQLKKGDKIGQGVIKSYLKTEDDCPGADRTGGFGSSDKDSKLVEVANEVGITVDELTNAMSDILKEYRESWRSTPKQAGEALKQVSNRLQQENKKDLLELAHEAGITYEDIKEEFADLVYKFNNHCCTNFGVDLTHE